jgi:hypothetical protein
MTLYAMQYAPIISMKYLQKEYIFNELMVHDRREDSNNI